MSDPKDVGGMIRAAWDRGEPAGWFERVYENAHEGQGRIPWAKMQPDPQFVAWAERVQLTGDGARALVIGCGLGDDAEALAARGFAVTAFDISPTAIAWCKERFPHSTVDYRVADLFAAPEAWAGDFAFVLENRTVQALPFQLAEQSIRRIAGFVAPGGRLLVLCHGREAHEPARGIPWPLSRTELAHFEAAGLEEAHFEDFIDGLRRFLVVYRRPQDAP